MTNTNQANNQPAGNFSPDEPRTTSAALAQIITGRRSVRAYKSQPVSHEQLMHLLEAARWAPSPHGRQPWRFAIVTRPEMRRRLAEAMSERWRQQLAQDGQTEPVVNLRLEKSQQRIITAPAHIIPCLYLEDLDHYPDPERQAAEETMAVQSLGCAAQNILLTAYSLGLDGGWMCAPLFCPDIVRGVLGLEPTLIPHALLTIGYAAKEPVRRPRRPLDELIAYYE